MPLTLPSLCQSVTPWEAPTEQVLAGLSSVVHCEGAMVALKPNGMPTANILHASGKLARLHLDAPRSSNGNGTRHGRSHLEQQDVEYPDARSVWRLSLVRQGEAFSEREKALSQLLLQQWHCRFMQPAELRMGRLLVRENFTILAADLGIQAWCVDRQPLLDRLLRRLPSLVEKRFGTPECDTAYELIVGDASVPVWVKLRFQCAARDAPRHAYVELRVLEAEEAPVLDHIDDDRLQRAIGHVDRFYDQTPDLAEMAKAASMSPFHFHRTFSSRAGVSPKQYVVIRQLQVAKWLLRAKELAIGEIADRCGFSSHGHFTATFHRLTGVKPSVFRDQQRFGLT